mmetsp:Transcript_7137/g.13129  ORF Transcript_7137/g.13129 Transcript_7137/m.13129 type:complete len:291 (-) Transcript_7137:150-1022(-)
MICTLRHLSPSSSLLNPSKQAAIAYQHDIMHSLLESPSTAHTSVPSFLLIHSSLRNSSSFSYKSREFLFIMPRIYRRQFHQIQILVKYIQRIGIILNCTFIIFGNSFFHGIDFCKEYLCRLYRRQIIRSLGLIDTKGISQQVHAGLHIIPARISYFISTTIISLFRTLTIDIFSLGLHHDNTVGIKEFFNNGICQISLDQEWSQFQVFMNRLLHTAIVASLGNGNCRVLSSSGATTGLGWSGRRKEDSSSQCRCRQKVCRSLRIHYSPWPFWKRRNTRQSSLWMRKMSRE